MVTHIEGPMYLGNIKDAEEFKGPRLCVLDREEWCREKFDQISVWTPLPQPTPKFWDKLLRRPPPLVKMVESKETRNVEFSKNPGDTWIPAMRETKRGYCANIANLNRAANWIATKMKEGKPFIVHCHQGMERSPLTIAWYYHKKRHKSMASAYKLLQNKREIVRRRDHWLCDTKEFTKKFEQPLWEY